MNRIKYAGRVTEAGEDALVWGGRMSRAVKDWPNLPRHVHWHQPKGWTGYSAADQESSDWAVKCLGFLRALARMAGH